MTRSQFIRPVSEMNRAEFITALRTTGRFRQADIADAIGISRSTYSQYENGYINPPPSAIFRLARFYCIPSDAILIHPEARRSGKNAGDDKTSDAEEHYPLSEQMQLLIDDINERVQFVNNPYNVEKYKRLSEYELELLYRVSQMSEDDKKDFLDMAKLKSYRAKNISTDYLLTLPLSDKGL